jgi:large-conductance mechanosensitive channel
MATSGRNAPTQKAATKDKLQVKHRAKSHARKHAGGFLDFVRTQGVVGLAVGLAIGTAAGDTVKKMVEGFINPIVQFIIGSREGLEAATLHVDLFHRSADIKWGAFVSSAITLLATALVIYLIVHMAKLDKIDKKKS